MNSDVTANAFRYSVFRYHTVRPFVDRLIRLRRSDYSLCSSRRSRFKESIINFPRIANWQLACSRLADVPVMRCWRAR